MRYLASSVPTGGVLALVGSIYRRNQTGTLVLETEQGQKKLYFVEGKLYLRTSVVPLAERIAAHLEDQKEGGSIEPDVALQELLHLTAEHLANWKVTAYRFFEGFQVDADELTGPLPTALLVMEGAALGEEEDMARLKMMGGPNAVLVAVDAPDSALIEPLTSVELALREHLSRPTRIADLLEGSGVESSRITEALSRLWALELVRVTTMFEQLRAERASSDHHVRHVEPPQNEPAVEEPIQELVVEEPGPTASRAGSTTEPLPPLPVVGEETVEATELVDEEQLAQLTAVPPQRTRSETLSDERRNDTDLRIWHYFGLTGDPFSLTPDPSFLYQSETHSEALAGLALSLLERRGLCAMTGEVGTGKTTLLYTLLGNLGVDFETAYVNNPSLPFDQLLEYVLGDFDVSVPRSPRRVDLLKRLNEFLILCAREQKIATLIIDEAQNLSDTTFESLRLLLNFETFDRKLLQIVLVGQPELGERLDSSSLRQITDRIAVRCQLDPLKQAEARQYVGYRLQVAGGDADLFSRRALSLATKKARGIPRRINVICHNAMLYAFAQNQQKVTRPLVAEAVGDLKR